MVDLLFKIVVLLCLAWLMLYVKFSTEEIGSENSFLNAAILQQAKQASNCAMSALDQVESFMFEQQGNLTAINKKALDKVKKLNEAVIDSGNNSNK